jgi:DNA mismatch endonuclease (patch repair protein)
MAAVRSTNSRPELAFRSALHRLGVRYRLGQTVTVGGRKVKPDLVFKQAKIAVFIDGCFWHGCPDHCRMPATNRDYWEAKIGRNVARDAADAERFSSAGWRVLRFWEHEDLAKAARSVAMTLRPTVGGDGEG